jgi:hypothetical protein
VQSGNWSGIGADAGANDCAVFALWLEHAPPVANASVAYAVAPGVALDAWASGGAAALAQSLTLLDNSVERQALLHATDAVLAAAVYAGGQNATVGAGPWRTSFAEPGAYLIRDGGDAGLALTAADPNSTLSWATTVAVQGRNKTQAAGPCCEQDAAGDVVFQLNGLQKGSHGTCVC